MTPRSSGQRVLVTGLGVVSPVGRDLQSFWHALLHEQTQPVEFNFAGIAPELIPHRWAYGFASDGEAASPQRVATSYAIEAVRSALADAGLSAADLDQATVGVSIGSAMGDQDAFEQRPPQKTAAGSFGEFAHASSAAVAGEFSLAGPNYQVNTACSSGGYSISLARDAIASGDADIMVAGGSEAISHLPMACFNRMRALDPLQCRPFDKDRQGTVGACGAAMVVLESEQSWRRRGCPPVYAEARGAGWSCDAHNVTAPEPTAHHLKLAMNDALQRSGIEAGDIDGVVAHGTGTRLNDDAERKIITEVLHGAGHPPFVYAPKSKLGHSGGASTAFSCVAAALMLEHGIVPPTANLAAADPDCPLRFVTGSPAASALHHLVVNGYGFGGNNISLVFSRFEGDLP